MLGITDARPLDKRSPVQLVPAAVGDLLADKKTLPLLLCLNPDTLVRGRPSRRHFSKSFRIVHIIKLYDIGIALHRTPVYLLKEILLHKIIRIDKRKILPRRIAERHVPGASLTQIFFQMDNHDALGIRALKFLQQCPCRALIIRCIIHKNQLQPVDSDRLLHQRQKALRKPFRRIVAGYNYTYFFHSASRSLFARKTYWYT